MIGVTYHDDLKEVQGDAVLAALLRAPVADAPFDRLEWWQGLEVHCAISPLIAVASTGPYRAVLPLRRVGRRIEALANWYTFRNRPIFSAGADQQALLAALAADLAKQAPHIELTRVSEELGEASALATAFKATGWLVYQAACDINHVLPLAGRSYAEYLASRPGAVRTTLKRKAGKVTVQIETAFNPASWAAYEAIYAHSWKPEEGAPAFLRAFAEAEGRAGRLRLGLAFADDVPVAAQFWTVEGGTAFIHKLAHTQESRSLSPGTTLSAALFEHVIDQDKVALVDFGTGDNPYKRDWMDAVRPRYKLTMLRRGSPGNWPLIARLWLRTLAGGRRDD